MPWSGVKGAGTSVSVPPSLLHVVARRLSHSGGMVYGSVCVDDSGHPLVWEGKCRHIMFIVPRLCSLRRSDRAQEQLLICVGWSLKWEGKE